MGEASGWVLDKIQNVYVNITSYKAIRGSCYIKTPPLLANKGAIINVKSKDNRCFEYSLLASEFPPKITKRNLQVIMESWII